MKRMPKEKSRLSFSRERPCSKRRNVLLFSMWKRFRRVAAAVTCQRLSAMKRSTASASPTDRLIRRLTPSMPETEKCSRSSLFRRPPARKRSRSSCIRACWTPPFRLLSVLCSQTVPRPDGRFCRLLSRICRCFLRAGRRCGRCFPQRTAPIILSCVMKTARYVSD